MRERLVCGPQTMSMPGPDTLVGASGAGRNEGRQPFPGDPSEEAAAASDAAPAPSPLSTFLTRSELVPFILELEKSLLVTREHDYAKAPDRVAVLQATTLLERKTEAATTLDGGARTEAGGFRAEQLPGCCGELAGMRRNMLISDENTTFRHLRGVVGLQAAIIREQQEQLYRKDRELASIRKDRDQLEARLERMERRLAVHQKRNTTYSTPDSEPHLTPSGNTLSVPRRSSRTESIIISERQAARSRSSSTERSRNRLRQHSNSTNTPVIVHDDKRTARKRLRTDDNNLVTPVSPAPVKKVKKQPKLTEIRTSVEYSGLGLVPVQDVLAPDISTNHSIGKDGNALHNETLFAAHNCLSNSLPSSNNNPITVPSWRLHPLQPLEEISSIDEEDISEDMFLRRHKKHEEDEKRRKRWDLQRTRALLEHQELLKKYNKKCGTTDSGAEKRDKLTSFSPKLEDVKEIEILPTVVVSAFGHPLPLLKKRDFELPWFDLTLREAGESVRTTRSKSRTSRTSAGSSDDV